MNVVKSNLFSKAWKKVAGFFQALERLLLTLSNAWKNRACTFPILGKPPALVIGFVRL
jgi:hypothetical protein